MAFTHRLILTHRCNANCLHCFNHTDRKLQDDMDYDLLRCYLEYNKDHIKKDSVKVMGGEPTLHPRFHDMMNMLVDYFSFVKLFTNGADLDILFSDSNTVNLLLNGKIKPIFNGLTFNDEDWKRQNIVIPFYIHCVVNERNETAIINKIRRLACSCANFELFISPDVQVNMYDKNEREKYKIVWFRFITSLREVVGKQKKLYGDHSFPLCFFDGNTAAKFDSLGMPVHNKCTCFKNCSGLIDPDFSIWFCNQFRIKVGNIFQNVKPFSYIEIDEILTKAREVKHQMVLMNPECANCPVSDYCKGGCFTNKLFETYK